MGLTPQIEIMPVAAGIPPRWLKIGQAAKWAAIGKKRLVALAESGDVIGFRDTGSDRGDWIFDRYSLDEYRIRQADPAETRKRALKILDGVK
jgi:hypothetical protein